MDDRIDEAFHASLSSIEDGVAGLADELTRHAHDLKSALQPIHSNAELMAVETDKQWRAIGELRTIVGKLADEFLRHRSDAAEQHREQMALLRQVAGLAPEQRHPAAER